MYNLDLINKYEILKIYSKNKIFDTRLILILQRCSKRGIEHDAPIARYYERLLTVQARGSQASHQVLRDILKEVQNNMVPRGLLKEWALHTFLDATDYWIFRKTVRIIFTWCIYLLCIETIALLDMSKKPAVYL